MAIGRRQVFLDAVTRRFGIVTVGLAIANGLCSPSVAAQSQTTLVGPQGGSASLSADGRYVAFSSTAVNLVAGDTNDQADVFVYDCVTGIIERVSVSTDGVQANSSSSAPAISADGRFVAFQSYANNLVEGMTFWGNVFVHDRVTGATVRVSVPSAQVHSAWEAHESPRQRPSGPLDSESPSISADGRFVAFHSRANLVPDDTNLFHDVFVHDLATGTTSRVSVGAIGQPNGPSVYPAISADGRSVAFMSYASNLVIDDTNGGYDIFVHDRLTATTTRVSVGAFGQANDSSYGPAISGDGRFVAFTSNASNLVVGDVNKGLRDVFVHDRQTGTTTRVGVSAAGASFDSSETWNPAISADGRFVAFGSGASTLVVGDSNGTVDVFVHDRATGVTRRVSVGGECWVQGNEDSDDPAISADGRFVAFWSASTNLDLSHQGPGVFLHDRAVVPSCGARPPLPAGDYDGDGRADVAVYRPSTVWWYVIRSTTGTGWQQQWGWQGDVPVAADYDGDGKRDVAIYRRETGEWFILESRTGSLRQQQWGWSTDTPVPADYDGDGAADVAVYRPSSGVWYISRSRNQTMSTPTLGVSSDVPVPRDYDGDGVADVAVYRPSTGVWYVVRSSTGTGYEMWWGIAEDQPVPGDYDGDGQTDVAVYRPSTGVWYVFQSRTGTGWDAQWGWPGDQPLVGDYDGDGRADPTVFRPGTGQWFVRGRGLFLGTWGIPEDIPH